MATHPHKEFFTRRLSLLLSRLERNRRKFLSGRRPEALHDFRVALRRLRTCLRLLETGYPPRLFLPVKAMLKGVTQITNSLRDLEVSAALWGSLPPPPPTSTGLRQWLRTQEEVRGLREREIRVELSSPRFTRELSALKAKLALRTDGRKTALLVAEAFAREMGKLRGLLQKTKGSRTGTVLFHKLRVQAKRVRYGLEEFKFLMPGQAGTLAACCKRAQSALGDWRDMESALRLLGTAGNGLFPETRPWREELKRRRRTAWKEGREAVRALGKTLDASNL